MKIRVGYRGRPEGICLGRIITILANPAPTAGWYWHVLSKGKL